MRLAIAIVCQPHLCVYNNLIKSQQYCKQKVTALIKYILFVDYVLGFGFQAHLTVMFI